VATTLLVASLTLTFRYLGRLCLHPPACTQALLKGATLLVYCRWLAEGSFQLTHVMWWPCYSIDQDRVSHGGQKEDKILLQPSQHYHKDEFQHISISARQRSQWRGQNLCGPFLRAILLMTVGLAMADSRETKGLITPPPRCDSVP